jgi:hypothetical protein
VQPPPAIGISRGVQATPANIIITDGTQHAVDRHCSGAGGSLPTMEPVERLELTLRDW